MGCGGQVITIQQLPLYVIVERYRASAPVCLCSPRRCNIGDDMCGPQKKRLINVRELERRKVVIPAIVRVAESHAHTGEDRGEFDYLVDAWKKTLFGGW